MLESVFRRARERGRAAFIPYVMAGDPDLATTAAIFDTLASAGVDAIEAGVPYGDPLADGPTIAAAGVRALRAGARMADVLRLVGQGRERGWPPIVLFTYYNPVYRFGIGRLAEAAAAAGVAGVIVPDVALEEGAELRGALVANAVEMPLLVAPSTARDRASRIAAQATGFVYVVSRLGVTGAGTEPDFSPLGSQIATMRALTDKPLAVGFGVSKVEHVRAVAPLADGIIVGSALIDAYCGSVGGAAAERVRSFVEPLLLATQSETAIGIVRDVGRDGERRGGGG